MLSQILPWISALVFLVCCSNQVQIFAITRPKLAVTLTANSTDERAYVSEMYALFKIVDMKYSKRVLEKAPDFAHFRDRINNWIEHNSDRWSEIESRLNYCKDLMKKGGLGTSIDDANPDIRWQLFIENGAPQNQLTFLSKCSQADTCTVWTYLWPELEISCWSPLGLNYPTEILTSDDRSFPVAHPVWPYLNYSNFPSSDGVDLWFSVWIPGNQFSLPTLEEGQLVIRIDLYDSTKAVLVASAEEICNLQVMRGILEALESQDRQQIRAMGYIGFPAVKLGKYVARLSIQGAVNNEGADWIEVRIEDKKISDLLILKESMVNGENVLPGIVRGELSLYDNPESQFVPGAKFGLYLETVLPSGHGEQFQVEVTLLRISEVPGRKSGLTTTGEFVVVGDSLDHPFTDGQWQTPQSQKVLEELASHSKSKTITLLRKKLDTSEKIKLSLRLPSNLSSGQYILATTISDPESQSYFLSARRVIRIAPSSSIAF